MFGASNTVARLLRTTWVFSLRIEGSLICIHLMSYRTKHRATTHTHILVHGSLFWALAPMYWKKETKATFGSVQGRDWVWSLYWTIQSQPFACFRAVFIHEQHPSEKILVEGLLGRSCWISLREDWSLHQRHPRMLPAALTSPVNCQLRRPSSLLMTYTLGKETGARSNQQYHRYGRRLGSGVK